MDIVASIVQLMMIHKYDLTIQFTVVRTAAAAATAAAVPITVPSSGTRATEAP